MVKEWLIFVLCIIAGILLRELVTVPYWLEVTFLIFAIILTCGYVFFVLMVLAHRGEEPEWEKRRREDDEEVDRRIEEGKRARREAWRAQGCRFRGTKWK